MGDRLGRKRWFLFGIALFTATALLAAFAQSTGMLIAARAAQGLGMDRAFVLSSAVIVLFGALAFVSIRDDVAAAREATATAAEAALVAEGAD